MLKRIATLVPVGLLTAATLTACGSSSTSTVSADCKPAHSDVKTLKDGTLTAAGYDLPPFSKIEGDEITDVDGDIIKAIAKKECLTVTVKSVQAAAAIPMVQNGQADIAFGDWYRTKERAAIVSLTDPIYTDQMGIISEDGVSSIPDMKGKSVGTVDGFLWVDDLKKYLGDLKVYSSPLNLYQDLTSGRLDIAVDSFGSGVYNTDKYDGKYKVEVAEKFDPVKASLQGAQSTFPTMKSETALLDALNEDIADLRDSGELAKIMKENGLDESAAEPGAPRLIG